MEELQRADKSQVMHVDTFVDMEDFERQKREVNRELIKLQQKMKQVVTTKEERYIDLRFFEWTSVVVVEDTNMYLKLDLKGAESPVTFTCEILDNSRADLQIFLSSKTREPDE